MQPRFITLATIITIVACACFSPPIVLRAQDSYRNYVYDDRFTMGAHLLPIPRTGKDTLHFDFSQNYAIDVDALAAKLGVPSLVDCLATHGGTPWTSSNIFTDPDRYLYWQCNFDSVSKLFWLQADTVGLKVLFIPNHFSNVADSIRAQENYFTFNPNLQVLEFKQLNTTLGVPTPVDSRKLLYGLKIPRNESRIDCFQVGTPRYATDPTMTALRIITPHWYSDRSSIDSSSYYRFTVTLRVDGLTPNSTDTLGYVLLFYRDRRFQDTCKCAIYSPFGVSPEGMRLDTLFITKGDYLASPAADVGGGYYDVSWLINMKRGTITMRDTVTVVETVVDGVTTSTSTSSIYFDRDSVVGRETGVVEQELSRVVAGNVTTIRKEVAHSIERYWVPIAAVTNNPFPEAADGTCATQCGNRFTGGWFGAHAIDESGSFNATDFLFKFYTTRISDVTFLRSRISPHMYDVLARGDLDPYLKHDVDAIFTQPSLAVVNRVLGRFGIDDEPIHPGLRPDGILSRKMQDAIYANDPTDTRGLYQNPQTNMDGFRILTGDLDTKDRKLVQVMAQQSYRVIGSYRLPVTYANPDKMDDKALGGLYRAQDDGAKSRRIAYNSKVDYKEYLAQSQESSHGSSDIWGLGRFLDYRNNDDPQSTKVFGPLVPYLARAVDVAQHKYDEMGPKTAVWNVLQTMGWNPELPIWLRRDEYCGAFDDEFDLRIPTPEEIVVQAWLSMNCGARGLIFGDFQWDNTNLGVMDPFTGAHSVEYGALRSPNGSLDTVKFHYPLMWVGMKSRFDAIKEVADDLHRIDTIVGWKNLVYNLEQMSVFDKRQTFRDMPLLDTLYTRKAKLYTSGGVFADTAAIDPPDSTYIEVTHFRPGEGDTAALHANARYLLITNRRLWPIDMNSYSSRTTAYGGGGSGLGNIDVRKPIVRFKNATNVPADSMLVEKIGADPAWSRRVAINATVDLDWLKPGRGALYRVTPIVGRGVSSYGTAFNNAVRALNPSRPSADTDRIVVYERDSAVFLRTMNRYGIWGAEYLVSDANDTMLVNTSWPWRRRAQNITPAVASVFNGSSCMVVWERRDSLNNTSVEARYFQFRPTNNGVSASARLRLSQQRVVGTQYNLAPAVVGIDSGYMVAWATPTRGIEMVAVRDKVFPTGANDVSLVASFWTPTLVLSHGNGFEITAAIDSLSQFPSLAYASNYRLEASPTNSLSGSYHFVGLAYQQGKAPAGPFIIYRPVGARFSNGVKPQLSLVEPFEHVSVNLSGCSFYHPSIAIDSFRVSVAFESSIQFLPGPLGPPINKTITLRTRKQPWGGTGKLVWNMPGYYWGDDHADNAWPSLTHFPQLTTPISTSAYDGGLTWFRTPIGSTTNQIYMYRYGNTSPTRLPDGKFPTMMLVQHNAIQPFASGGVFYRGDNGTGFLRPRFLGGNGTYYPAALENNPLNRNPAFSGSSQRNGHVIAAVSIGSKSPAGFDCNAYWKFFGGFWITTVPKDPVDGDPWLPLSFDAMTGATDPYLLDTISKAGLIAATGPFTSSHGVRVNRILAGGDSVLTWLDSAGSDPLTGAPANIYVVTELVRTSDSAVIWSGDTATARRVGSDRLTEYEDIPVDSVASDTTEVFIRLRMGATNGLQYTLSGGFHFLTDSIPITFRSAVRRVREKEVSADAPVSGMRLSVIPNPLNRTGELRVDVARAGTLQIAIYDLMGRRVRVLDDLSVGSPGEYAVDLDLGDLPQGRYTLQVIDGRESAATQFVLIR